MSNFVIFQIMRHSCRQGRLVHVVCCSERSAGETADAANQRRGRDSKNCAIRVREALTTGRGQNNGHNVATGRLLDTPGRRHTASDPVCAAISGGSAGR